MENIEECIRQYITMQRFYHSVGVKETAVKLARKYGCDESRVACAALLHDVARDLPLERMQSIVRGGQSNKVLSDIVFNNPGLLHAHAGRIIAQKEFNIDDEDILRSIELHTTGGERMSLLNKLIFIADYIEPGRRFCGVRKARSLARKNVDETVLYIFKSMLYNLLRRGVFICRETLLGYNEHILNVRSCIKVTL